MPTQAEINAREECKKSVSRLQQFDPASLSREGELGLELNFAEVVPAASRLIGLYNQISLSVLDDLPMQQLNSLKEQANADFNRLEQILKFSSKQGGDVYSARNSLIQTIENTYQQSFNVLHPLIGYSTSKSADFKRLETEARAMLQTIEDRANELTIKLQEDKKASEQILEDIRKVAAEQGVSQQAIYFRDAAQEHETKAGDWLKQTRRIAWVLGLYAVLTLFLHKIPFIAPTDALQTAQLAISKVLIFGVLSYMLYLSTKNYLAHKHNAVINRHRQNALMTYQALADAAKDMANREVILTHASACIFAPQSTGYSGGQGPEGPAAKSVVELLTNTMSREK